MFDRNTSVSGEARDVHVTLTRGDDRELSVCLSIPKSVDVADFLNRSEAFLKVVEADRTVRMIAKSDIKELVVRDVPKANELSLAHRSHERMDPYALLGVTVDAAQSDIHAAYHARVKAYHPDRLDGLDLPAEMCTYATSMLKRINAAYAEIRSATRAA